MPPMASRWPWVMRIASNRSMPRDCRSKSRVASTRMRFPRSAMSTRFQAAAFAAPRRAVGGTRAQKMKQGHSMRTRRSCSYHAERFGVTKRLERICMSIISYNWRASFCVIEHGIDPRSTRGVMRALAVLFRDRMSRSQGLRRRLLIV